MAGGNPLVPLNHNRDIALYRGGNLSQLGFRQSHKTVTYDRHTRQQSPLADDAEGTRDAASIFQTAYELYSKREYRLH